jgi:Zn-dependent peptidase ImmA (M78 family)
VIEFPTSIRSNKVFREVSNFLLDKSISQLPINPFQIIKNNKWGLITYTELAEIHNLEIADIIAAYQSEDGYTIFDGENYTIAYNDAISTASRIRFTLMHEIGHIVLRHLTDFEETILHRSTLTEKKYKVLENETNTFARNVLAPAPIVSKLKSYSDKDISHIFQISLHAATIRLRYQKKDLICFGDNAQQLITCFQNFITKINTTKHCKKCGIYFQDENACYCPICGSNQLTKNKGAIKMIYDGFKLDENGRAKICPQCENEEIEHEDEHCKVCGIPVVNRCTGGSYVETYYNNKEFEACGTPAMGNARYCIKCGGETKFFEIGLLKNWTKELE